MSSTPKEIAAQARAIVSAEVKKTWPEGPTPENARTIISYMEARQADIMHQLDTGKYLDELGPKTSSSYTKKPGRLYNMRTAFLLVAAWVAVGLTMCASTATTQTPTDTTREATR